MRSRCKKRPLQGIKGNQNTSEVGRGKAAQGGCEVEQSPDHSRALPVQLRRFLLHLLPQPKEAALHSQLREGEDGHSREQQQPRGAGSRQLWLPKTLSFHLLPGEGCGAMATVGALMALSGHLGHTGHLCAPLPPCHCCPLLKTCWAQMLSPPPTPHSSSNKPQGLRVKYLER